MMMSILFLWRWDLVIVTYNVPGCLDAFSDYTRPVGYFRSARVYLLFMGKIRSKGKTSLHCS